MLENWEYNGTTAELWCKYKKKKPMWCTDVPRDYTHGKEWKRKGNPRCERINKEASHVTERVEKAWSLWPPIKQYVMWRNKKESTLGLRTKWGSTNDWYSQIDKLCRLDNQWKNYRKQHTLRPPVHLILEASCGLSEYRLDKAQTWTFYYRTTVVHHINDTINL